MAFYGVAPKQKHLVLTTFWHFGLACLLSALIFLPYALIVFFWGALPVDMVQGISSPGGTREISYLMAPWGAMLVAAGFTLLMAVRVFRDRQIVARWKASLLLALIFLLLSAFVLWQAPFVPESTISFYYFSANTILLMSLYPAFFGALTSAFLCERHDQATERQKTGWWFILFSVPAALVGSAFCWFAITAGLASDQRYWEGYLSPPYPPLTATLYMVPTLLGVSLVGGFLGACLYRWFQRAFSRPEEPVSLATEGSSTSLIEQAPSSAGAARATWAAIGWGYIWRLGLAGLVSFIITGLLLHTRISMYFTPILFIPAPLFSHPLIELDITFSPGDWLIPSSLVTLFSIVPFLARFPISSLIFLPFVLPFPGVLIEHTLWKNRTIFPGLGIVLVFLGMAIGAKDLLLTLLEYLNSFWPFGTGSALFYCAALLCETTALALLAALALGNAQKPMSRWNQRLLWLMLGAASFAGSLLPLAAALQKFIYFADGRAPFRFLSLDTATITIVLAAGLLLSFPAAFLGGWLRTRLIR